MKIGDTVRDVCGLGGRVLAIKPGMVRVEWRTGQTTWIKASYLETDKGEMRRGIYIASKTAHAERWRFLRDKVGDPIISTWIDEAGAGESADLNDLWTRCIAEATSCELLIVYREPGEVLKGAWVEVGAALAVDTPVYAVGLEEFTISKHKKITHFPDMKEAIAASRKFLAVAGRPWR